jgi:quercetin dioxygenase-like cupin family protein
MEREGGQAMGMIRKNFDQPDEVRPFEENSGQLAVLDSGQGLVGRAVFQPGWQWSKHIAPIAGTDSCQSAHVGYQVSGQMHVVMNNGEELDFGPGDLAVIPPGHDAWTVGDEPVVFLDWQGFADYAKR